MREFVAVLMFLAVGLGADAQNTKVPGPGALRKADTNGDQKMSGAEFAAAFPGRDSRVFERLDKNDDGVVDRKDRSGRRLPDMYRRADANGDERVTFEELQDAAPDLTAERFGRLDRNGDGFLSAADRRVEDKQPETSSKQDQRATVLWDMYRKADRNEDGETTYEELTAAKPGFPRENFDRHDQNGDGVISAVDR